MTSAIDPLVPATGSPAVKADFRANFAAAKSEIEALQGASGVPAGGATGQVLAKHSNTDADVEWVSQTAGGTASGTTLVPYGTGAASTNVQTWVRQSWVSVMDFGAVGNGSTDDSNAIEAAIGAVNVSAGGWTGSKPVYFPKGKYRITRAVFSHTGGGLAGRGPIKFFGDHAESSVIFLDPPSAAETWMYDNGTTQLYSACQWYNMGFQAMGTNAAYASGFRFYSTGGEQASEWHHCNFGQNAGLLRAFLLTGSANASEIQVAHCDIRNTTGPMMTFDNSQAVNIDFLNTHCQDIKGDIFYVTATGGGELRVWGGSFIWGTGTGTGWLLNVVGSGGHTFKFYGIKPECHDMQAGIVQTANGSLIEAWFHGIDWRGVLPGAWAGVIIDDGAKVTFTDCWINRDCTYTLSATGLTATVIEPGSITFNNCRLPAGISGKITFAGSFGCARAIDCTSWQNVTESEAADFDMGWQYVARHGRTVRRKLAVIKTNSQTWPPASGSAEAASAAATDRTVLLPVGAKITGFQIYKPASGVSTNQYQIHVGSNNRGASWATSVQAAHNVAHVINVQLTPDAWIDVGADANLRKATMWSNPGGPTAGAADIVGEFALVEYI